VTDKLHSHVNGAQVLCELQHAEHNLRSQNQQTPHSLMLIPGHEAVLPGSASGHDAHPPDVMYRRDALPGQAQLVLRRRRSSAPPGSCRSEWVVQLAAAVEQRCGPHERLALIAHVTNQQPAEPTGKKDHYAEKHSSSEGCNVCSLQSG
jgi:hypothetical protein